ncbi:MAG: hypothetical protein WCQ99_15305 [Pseudomonadota bacterium]
MQIFQEAAKVLSMNPASLERDSLKTFLEKELRDAEVEIYRIAAKHGIKSILELDEKLKKGEATEDEISDDFMELDYLETRKDNILRAIEIIK